MMSGGGRKRRTLEWPGALASISLSGIDSQPGQQCQSMRLQLMVDGQMKVDHLNGGFLSWKNTGLVNTFRINQKSRYKLK